MPTSPVDHYLTGMSLPLTDENREIVTRSMGLDQPLLKQYTTWITRLFEGDWGKSLNFKAGYTDRDLWPKCLILLESGWEEFFWELFSAYFLGFGAALHRNGFCDRFSSALSVFTQAVPGFIVAILIIYFFGVKLKAVKFFTGDGKFSVFTVIVIMAFYRIGPWARVVRNAFREEMNKSYVRFSISGESPKQGTFFPCIQPDSVLPCLRCHV